MNRITVDSKEYMRIHTYLHRYWLKSGICEHCGRIGKTQWADKNGNYKLNRDEWLELCPKCHHKYDNITEKRLKTMFAIKK